MRTSPTGLRAHFEGTLYAQLLDDKKLSSHRSAGLAGAPALPVLAGALASCKDPEQLVTLREIATEALA